MSLRQVAITLFVLTLLAAPFPSPGQQPGKVYRIGFLSDDPDPGDQTLDPQHCPLGPPVVGQDYWRSLLEGLREHGYVPGQNLVIECRYTAGRAERASALAAELVNLKPDLIIALSTVNALAAKRATTEIPIIIFGTTDPIATGLVPSFAHPGGNVTGLADTGIEIQGKLMELLKEAVPTVSRVAVLHAGPYPGPYPGGRPGPGSDFPFRETEKAAARALGLTAQFYRVREPSALAGAFSAMSRERAEALYVTGQPFLWTLARQIVELAAQNRLPAVYQARDYVQVGGLMSYDTDWLALMRRVGIYVNKIFKGAKPGDLPVEQPTKFDLFINLKTAKALGLTIPPSVLARADELIQ
jgi:putative ABC transport system substrate-binding protein